MVANRISRSNGILVWCVRIHFQILISISNYCPLHRQSVNCHHNTKNVHQKWYVKAHCHVPIIHWMFHNKQTNFFQFHHAWSKAFYFRNRNKIPVNFYRNKMCPLSLMIHIRVRAVWVVYRASNKLKWWKYEAIATKNIVQIGFLKVIDACCRKFRKIDLDLQGNEIFTNRRSDFWNRKRS